MRGNGRHAALDAAVDPSDRPAQARMLIGTPDGVRVQGCSPTRPRTTWIVIGRLEFDTQFPAVPGLVAFTLILAAYPDCHISKVLTLPNIAL